MNSQTKPIELIVKSLEERAKELSCLYSIEEVLHQKDLSFEEYIYHLLEKIPLGFQFTDNCRAKIVIEDVIYQPTDFVETPWFIEANIEEYDEHYGTVSVYYLKEFQTYNEGPFLSDERRLINTIADRVGHFLFYSKMKEIYSDNNENEQSKPEWMIVLDMLKKTDQNLFSVLSRKMLNHLFCKGINESRQLFVRLGSTVDFDKPVGEINRPSKKQVLQQSFKFGLEIYQLASNYFGDTEIMSRIQKWIYEEKSHHLIKALANQNTPLSEVFDALRRYYQLNPGYDVKSTPTRQGIKVALIRRFLTDQLDFIEIAKNFLDVDDFWDLLQNMIFPPESHGKIGGKGAGIFLANKIIEKTTEFSPLLESVKLPKTWYITSDGLMNFMYYNNMEDVIEQKYKDIDEIRQEYPHIVQAFKNSQFPLEITNGLSRALDDFGDNPVIVRSSSLLEDRIGAAFAGKYKSLFLANQGTKKQKMEDLMDAIAEVYASTFGPDPIGYRIERGLLDFNEEMGIMIQEVVGTKVGKYFFPAFAGVAFSFNEFRWSPRIKREDGLIRMVCGLGTRSVDRIGDDFPILIAPGNPNLRVNLTFQEVVGYAPKYIDVINVETNTFDTISIKQLISEVGNAIPMLNDLFSIIDGHHIKKPVGLGIDTKQHDIIVTFDNLVNRTKYLEQIKIMLSELKDKLDTPVDIEFACDGKNLYLLQCRPQSTNENQSVALPTDIPANKTIFTANKYISNGKVPAIYYIVYVDPIKYSEVESLDDLIDIGVAVGKLNKVLPKKTFILMGPGRWGSRDDIRLGVRITYSDIHNTAVLIEIARKKGNYVPDLSFGTHFFQDLVEAGIRYIPLYPDSDGVVFNQEFFQTTDNILTRFLPEYAHLNDVLKVINVRESTGGQALRILMNADEDKAMAILADDSMVIKYSDSAAMTYDSHYDEPLQWRKRMAESIGLQLDGKRFGVKGFYLFGTVFNETATANSDIDFIVHFAGNDIQKRELLLWFEGWNLSLSQVNYNRTGYTVHNFIDVTILTDDELREQKYYSDLINPANHSSKKLTIKAEA